MCIIGISTETNSITLKSFVTIGRTQVIEGCVDYSSTTQCSKCKSGYHLDSTNYGDLICVQDIPGCV